MAEPEPEPEYEYRGHLKLLRGEAVGRFAAAFAEKDPAQKAAAEKKAADAAALEELKNEFAAELATKGSNDYLIGEDDAIDSGEDDAIDFGAGECHHAEAHRRLASDFSAYLAAMDAERAWFRRCHDPPTDSGEVSEIEALEAKNVELRAGAEALARRIREAQSLEEAGRLIVNRRLLLAHFRRNATDIAEISELNATMRAYKRFYQRMGRLPLEFPFACQYERELARWAASQGNHRCNRYAKVSELTRMAKASMREE